MFALLLPLIFIRPFISSLAFAYTNFIYAFLLIGFLFIYFLNKRLQPALIKPIIYPLGLFILALLLSTIFSYNKTASFQELYKYTSAILLLLFAVTLSDKEKKRLLFCIITAGILISLSAIYQYFFGFRHTLDYLAKMGGASEFTLDYLSRRRVFFPFVTPNTLGGYLAMIIPLGLAYRNKIWIILPLFLALLLSKSLGAFLSLFLAIAIFFYLRGGLKKRSSILFLCGLLIVIGFVFLSRITAQKQHLQPIFSTLMRINYWQDTLGIIKSHPFAGVGLGNFNLAQSRYAHNSYLQILAEMGIIGLVSFLWLIVAIFKSALKNTRSSTEKGQAAILATASLVFLLHNLIDFSFFLPEIAFLWWLMLGLLLRG